MESARTINLILSDLSVEVVKLEDNLERAINENINITQKLENVKRELKALVICEQMITRFQSLVQPPPNAPAQ